MSIKEAIAEVDGLLSEMCWGLPTPDQIEAIKKLRDFAEIALEEESERLWRQSHQ